jgi:hypothetical protein
MIISKGDWVIRIKDLAKCLEITNEKRKEFDDWLRKIIMQRGGFLPSFYAYGLFYKARSKESK